MHIFAEHFPFLCYSLSLCLARDFSLSILLIIYIDCLVVFCFNLTDNYHTIKAILLWKTDLIIIRIEAHNYAKITFVGLDTVIEVFLLFTVLFPGVISLAPL